MEGKNLRTKQGRGKVAQRQLAPGAAPAGLSSCHWQQGSGQRPRSRSWQALPALLPARPAGTEPRAGPSPPLRATTGLWAEPCTGARGPAQIVPSILGKGNPSPRLWGLPKPTAGPRGCSSPSGMAQPPAAASCALVPGASPAWCTSFC